MRALLLIQKQVLLYVSILKQVNIASLKLPQCGKMKVISILM